MSRIRANNFTNREGTGSPTFPNGLSVTGILTATSTIVGTGVTINASGINVVGVITATSFSGSGASLTGVVTATSAIIGTGVTINSSGISLAGVTTVAAGSTSAPSITPTGDSNTGIFFPSADTIAFGEGGVEVARFDSSGRLGIATVTPNSGLHVNTTYNILKGFNRRPPLTRGPLFTKTAATTLSVIADCALNGFFYSSATAVTMPSHSNNTDYAIWQHPTTGALVGDASFVTAPAGATGGSIVAGYHYIPSGRPTAFNNGSPTSSAEILEYSIWDLTWRPECPDPRGMTNIDGRFWCDLYFCGSTSYATTAFSAVPSSKIGLTIADSSSPALIPSFYGGNGSTAYTTVSGNNPGSWYNFAEVAHSFGKRFMWSWELQAAVFGAPEAGSRGTDPGTVIWERQSKWGLAQATGTLLVWGAERLGIYTGSSSNTNTGGRGTEFADSPRAALLGGVWDFGSSSGSRSADWSRGPSHGSDSIGARFACNHLTLG